MNEIKPIIAKQHMQVAKISLALQLHWYTKQITNAQIENKKEILVTRFAFEN